MEIIPRITGLVDDLWAIPRYVSYISDKNMDIQDVFFLLQWTACEVYSIMVDPCHILSNLRNNIKLSLPELKNSRSMLVRYVSYITQNGVIAFFMEIWKSCEVPSCHD